MLAELRRLIDDRLSPYFWPDATLLGWLAEGEDTFCDDTGYFRDGTSYSITLEAGTQVYALPSDRIIETLSIWNGYTRLTQPKTSEEFDAASLDWGTTTGVPTMWKQDVDTGSIIFYPTPSDTADAVVLSLRVWRYSLVSLDDDASEAAEVPSRFHRACIEWAAYKALNEHDAETQDPVKAAEHLAMYKDYARRGLAAFRRSHGITTYVGTDPAYRT